MRIKVIYDGNTYISKWTDEITAEELKDKIYGMIENGKLTRFTMDLEDGGYLILGPIAIQTAVIVIM